VNSFAGDWGYVSAEHFGHFCGLPRPKAPQAGHRQKATSSIGPIRRRRTLFSFSATRVSWGPITARPAAACSLRIAFCSHCSSLCSASAAAGRVSRKTSCGSFLPSIGMRQTTCFCMDWVISFSSSLMRILSPAKIIRRRCSVLTSRVRFSRMAWQ